MKVFSRRNLFFTLIAALLISNLVWGWQLFKNKKTHHILSNELASSTTALESLQEENGRLVKDLEMSGEQLNDRQIALEAEQERNANFENQIRKISGTVGTLDKLAKTDKELLQKYSRVYFLNENYSPQNIKQIDKDYVLPGRADQYFQGDALKYLYQMLDAAHEDGVDLYVLSAYRSFDSQQELKGRYTQIYGSGANAFSADQGYSEHQLGTTVDIVDPANSDLTTAFAQTEAYKWLQDNAYRYGFVLSYPENNSYYMYEPWHWRFVGRDLAHDLHRADANFYDWDQRKIDGYLVNLFD